MSFASSSSHFGDSSNMNSNQESAGLKFVTARQNQPQKHGLQQNRGRPYASAATTADTMSVQEKGHRSSKKNNEHLTRSTEENEEAPSVNFKGPMRKSARTASTHASSLNEYSNEESVPALRRSGHKTLWQRSLDVTEVPVDIPGAPGKKKPSLGHGDPTAPNEAGQLRTLVLAAPSLTPKERDGTPVGAGDLVAGAGEQSGIRSPIAESSGEDEYQERNNTRNLGGHSVLYYIWVLGSVLFVLLAVPIAMLLFPSRHANITSLLLQHNGIVAGSKAVCIDDVSDTPICTEYPKSRLPFDQSEWKPSNKIRSPPPPEGAELGRTTVTMVRPVICVLNLGSQEERQQFAVTDLHAQYCTVVLWASLSLGSQNHQRLGRRGTLAVGRHKFDEMVKRVKAFRTANKSLPIYVTLGGERDDSPAFVTMLQDSRWRSTISGSMQQFNDVIDGVNVDWNHPQDHCDTLGEAGFRHLHVFLRQLKNQGTSIMLTVPASRELVSKYGLHETLLDMLSYVVVTTHKLRPCPHIVGCSGTRQFSTAVFLQVRAAYDARYRQKFAYSISVRANMLLARLPALGELAYDTGPVFDGMPSKKGNMPLALKEVCRKDGQKSDDECTLALMDSELGPDNMTWYLVATFSTAHQMRRRMSRAYDDAMGDTTVAVFDTHLDDLSGKCDVVNGQPSVSPLLAAIATATRQTGSR